MIYRPRFSSCVAVIFFAAALPSFAYADDVRSKKVLPPAQLDAFAALVGEPLNAVERRLSTDPSLVPLAATAAEARRQRKHSGKILTIAGFTILGVGTTVGLFLIQSGGRSTNCTSGASGSSGCDTGTNLAPVGIGVAVLSQVVGLALAIPGILKMARESESETAALARYHSTLALNRDNLSLPNPGPSLQAGLLESKMPTTRFLLPLLSGTF